MKAGIKDALPEKSKSFSTVSLSCQTICRRNNDISAEIVRTLHDRIKEFKAYPLASDESMVISGTLQLIRIVGDFFQVTEERLGLLSLKYQTRGEDIFQAIKQY